MKEIKVLQYKKNSKFEIEFTNLDEVKKGDFLILNCKGSSDCIYDFPVKRQGIRNPVLVKNLTFTQNNVSITLSTLLHIFNNEIYLFDVEEFVNNIMNHFYNCNSFNNIIPKWNIPEESAVLFLSEQDYCRYENIANQHHSKDGMSFIYQNELEHIQAFKKISIILPQLHAEDKSCPYHIENINKFCKELKEKYGVERIELFVSRCFLQLSEELVSYFKCHLLNKDCIWASENFSRTQKICYDFDKTIDNIDKITTTNSTGILEVQDGERLQVIDCVEFFKDL